MKNNFSQLGLILVTVISICACNAAAPPKTLATNNATPSPSPTPKQQNDDLRKKLEQIAARAQGRVGVAVEVLETGESVSLDQNGRFPMQSVYKLPIGMATLAQVESGKLTLEQIVRVEKSDYVRLGMHSPLRDKNPNGGVEVSVNELLRLAVSESDGTASDVLLKLVGVDNATKYLNDLGINEIIIANSEKEIGQDWETQYRNWSSPNGSLELLRALYERRGVSEQNQKLLYKLMTETPTGPRRLKGLLPATAIVAHKTGTSGTKAGVSAATNDIGLITLPNGKHVAIAVYVSDSRADLVARERVIAEIAKAVWDEFGRR